MPARQRAACACIDRDRVPSAVRTCHNVDMILRGVRPGTGACASAAAQCARVLRRLFVMVGLAVTFYVLTIGGLSRALPTTAHPSFPPLHSHYPSTLA